MIVWTNKVIASVPFQTLHSQHIFGNPLHSHCFQPISLLSVIYTICVLDNQKFIMPEESLLTKKISLTAQQQWWLFSYFAFAK